MGAALAVLLLLALSGVAPAREVPDSAPTPPLDSEPAGTPNGAAAPCTTYTGAPTAPAPSPGGAAAAADDADAVDDADADAEFCGALSRGERRQALVVFLDHPGYSYAEVKARVLSPSGAASRAGVLLVQDYESLPVALLSVGSLAALEALRGDPWVASVEPDRTNFAMWGTAPHAP